MGEAWGRFEVGRGLGICWWFGLMFYRSGLMG